MAETASKEKFKLPDSLRKLGFGIAALVVVVVLALYFAGYQQVSSNIFIIVGVLAAIAAASFTTLR